MIKDKVNTVEEQALGEKWEDLKDRDPKNTHKEMKLLKKKIKYLIFKYFLNILMYFPIPRDIPVCQRFL